MTIMQCRKPGIGMLATLAAAVLIVGTWLLSARYPQQERATLLPVALSTHISYTDEVARLDDGIDGLIARTKRDPHSWLAEDSLAASYRLRAQLTGDTLDYGRAADALTRSFAIAGPDAGPFLTRAQLNSSVHRYPAIPDDLRRAERCALVGDRTKATIATLRGDSAFYAGRYDDALRQYAIAIALVRDPNRLFSFANYYACTGEPRLAEQFIAEAEICADPSDRITTAWLAVEHGLFARERGDFTRAMHHYQRAIVILPGWWTAESRIADLHAHDGRQDEAIRVYSRLAERMAKPEIMDALFVLLQAAGRTEEAAQWKERSGLIYAAMVKDQPEAACGHALDHALSVSRDAVQAVEFAIRNQALRPGAESTIKMARALILAKRPADARRAIETVLQSAWNTYDLHHVAAQVYDACDRPDLAMIERQKSHTIDPSDEP